jgi:drug/metabolite transporter (DMT)-like permease
LTASPDTARGGRVVEPGSQTAYFLSAQAGLLTVAAVNVSLYPGVTLALAAVLLGERPSRRQDLGLALGALPVVLVPLA